MKHRIFQVMLFICLSFSLFAQTHDYRQGNGTLMGYELDEGTNWEVRWHNQVVEIGTPVTILRVAESVEGDEYTAWLHVTKGESTEGWLFFGRYTYGSAQFKIPYFDERWSVLDEIESSGKVWTVRKMIYQRVSIWNTVDIFDNPGTGSAVIGKITSPDGGSPQINLDVTEATEEIETIGGVTDRWLKIKFEGVSGWIFGGEASIERGGPKYYTPDNIIDFQFGYY